MLVCVRDIDQTLRGDPRHCCVFYLVFQELLYSTMSGRDTRGSQSMQDLSAKREKPRGRSYYRGRGRGQGRGGKSHVAPGEIHEPHHPSRPLIENPPMPLLGSHPHVPYTPHPRPDPGYSAQHNHAPPSSYPPNAPPSHYPPNSPPSHYPPNTSSHYPPDAPPSHYPPDAPPSHYLPNAPPSHYPPNAPSSHYPPNVPFSHYPSNVPPSHYHPNAPPSHYPPNAPPSHYPPNAPPSHHPPNAPPSHHPPNAPPSHHPSIYNSSSSAGNDYPRVPNQHPHAPPVSHPTGKKETSSTSGDKKPSASYLDMKDLLQALVLAPYHKLSSKTIMNKFKCSERGLQCVCSQHKSLISVCETPTGMEVDLSPTMKICDEYLGNKGCMNSDRCSKLHICKAFACGRCFEGTTCEFGHVWKTNHNNKIFEAMGLDSFTEIQLKNVMKKAVLRQVGISVCAPYNDGTHCNGSTCHALHICQKLLDAGGKCEDEACGLNHDILDAKCLSLLTLAGVDTNDSKRDIVNKVRKLVQPSGQPSGQPARQPARQSDHQPAHANVPKKDNNWSVRKLGCFQTMDQQESLVSTVVRSLVVTPNYWNFLEKLQERLDIGKKDFIELLQLYKRTFLIYQSEAGTLVKLQPKFAICAHYKSMQKCHAGKECNFLHLCNEFLNGDCKNSKCTRQHKLSTSPNREVMKRHFLLSIPETLVWIYLKARLQFDSMPYICFAYKNGNCRNENCGQLHVCYDVLFTLKSCYQQDCDKNHDVMSDHNSKLLSSFADVSDTVLKSALSARVSSIPGTTDIPAPCQQPIINAGKPKNPTAKKEKKNNPESKPKFSKTPAVKPKSPTAKSSSQLDGNVIVSEICLDYIEGSCNPATSLCPKLHARVAYHWQFCLNGSWTNFAFPHSNHLENQYRDVSRDSADLGPLEYGRSVQEKQTFSMLNDYGLVVDFDTMMLTSPKSPAVSVRRVGTPSSTLSSSNFATVYGWFFKDKNEIWIEYGNCDSTEEELHSTTMTSMDIEAVYSTTPFTLQMNTGQFTYTLNFSAMNQTNNQTYVVRPVRRRPKRVLVEKLKPDDPYNLNSKPVTKVPVDIVTSTPPSAKEETASSGKYPPFWTKMDGLGPKFYKVDLSSPEGSELVRSILLSMPSAEVLGIRRLQNTFHYNFFENQMNRHKAMTKKSVLNVQRLFHGTRETHVSLISTMNFEWRQAYADSGHKFGRGAYFFNNAALAHQFASNLVGEDSSSAVVLAVADVYVGSVALGDPSMVRPPPGTSGGIVDTTVDNLRVPSIFVKYNNKEYCPHYFINIKE